jgi:hypothetical protein
MLVAFLTNHPPSPQQLDFFLEFALDLVKTLELYLKLYVLFLHLQEHKFEQLMNLRWEL